MLARLKNAWIALAATPLAFFGLGFHKAWMYLSVPEFSTDFLGIVSMRIVFDLTCAVAALCLGALALKLPSEIMRRIAFPLAVGLQIGSAMLSLVAHTLAPDSALVPTLASAAGASGIVTMALLWTDLYASFNPARVALYYSGSIVFGNLLCFSLESNVPPRLSIIMMALPACTALCYKASLKRKGEERPFENLRADTSFIPWKAILFIAVYAFAHGVSIATQQHLSFLEKLPVYLPTLVVLAAVLLDAKRFNFETVYRMAFPLMVCGFLLVAAMPGLDGQVSSFLITASYTAAEILIVLIICSMAYRSAVSAFFLFGIMKAFQYFAKTLGMGFGSMLETMQAHSTASAVTTVVVILMVVGASMLLFSERNVFSNWGANASLRCTNGGGSETDQAAVRIEALAESYALTQRETEVLFLMAQGKTVAGIGKDMFIAEGTVKAHIQHIYQKLDVHSRKELLKLLGR